jgi:hypothetical protein
MVRSSRIFVSWESTKSGRPRKFLTVVVDQESRRVVWAAEGQSAKTLTQFFHLLGPARCENIQAVSIDCGNLKNGFARIRCPFCKNEYLLAFSCKRRGFCPSCSAKRSVLWGEFVREKVLADCLHRHLVFSIPKMFRIFFLYNRKLLPELSRCA